MIWTCVISREVFISLLKAERLLEDFHLPKLAASEGRDLPPLAKLDLLLAWRDDPNSHSRLPDLIVLPNGETDDFLAWTSTYLGDYRPLTAQIRVLSKREAMHYFNTSHNECDGRTEAIFAGLIISETLAYFDVDREPTTIPGVAFFSTYSFCRARHYVLWSDEERKGGIYEDWHAARKFGGQEIPEDISQVIEPVWDIVADLIDSDFGLRKSQPVHVIQRACLEIIQTGAMSSRSWSDVIEMAGLTTSGLIESGLLREDRVKTFQSAMAEFNRKPTLAGQFICAYLANAIAPGTLEHLSLVKKLAGSFRATLIWYGLLASITPHSGVRDAFRGLGRRVLRDVFRPASLLDPPTADCALSELAMLAGKEGASMIVQSGGYASVELAPCITTFIRWGGDSSLGQRETSTQSQLLTRNSRSVEHSIREIADLTKRLTS